MSNDQENAKIRAARAGAEFVQNGMTIGLGSGSTSELLVLELGERLKRETLNIRAVATSYRTAKLALNCGIRLIEPDDTPSLDLVIDGADEVDPDFRMIKGRGGALLREKIVATAAVRRVILVDDSKLVSHLGERHSLPVEIAAFATRWTIERLSSFASEMKLRTTPEGEIYRTDGGNAIVDMKTGPIADPASLEERLLAIPGVFETGLFIGLCDVIVVADREGTRLVHQANR